MADKKKRLIASMALAAGLAAGGVAGFVLGVPGVSGAQTTTTVPDAPTTTVPDSGDTTPDRPARGDGKNCPEKDGEGTRGSNAGFSRGSGRGRI